MAPDASGSQRFLFTPDLIAGFSIAGLLLPEAVAYAGIAGVPPQAGVVALLAGLACYGLIGTSRFAIVSATSSSAAVLLAATSSIAGPDLALRMMLGAGLILLTGVFFIIARLSGLGGVSNFIAKPVLRGFAFGLAITIVVKQLAKIVVVHPGHADLFRYSWDLVAKWPEWNYAGLVIAGLALIMLKGLARWHTLPGALLVIGAGIALDVTGITTQYGIAPVGPINLALHWPTVPDLDREQWLRLGELAVAMVLILYAESYGSIRTFAMRHGDVTSANRDLIALGVANLSSGLFHGMPVGAGYSATSANEAAGAQSRWAGWIAAGVVLTLVLTVLRWIEHTPEPVLAAIVIHAVSHTLRLGSFVPYFAWRRDRIIAVTAVLAVLILGVLNGLLAAVAVSLMMFLRNLSEPRVALLGRLGASHDYVDIERHPEAQRIPDVLIVRPETPLFFANAEQVFTLIHKRIEGTPNSRALIISLEECSDLDSSGIEALGELADYLQQRDIRLLLARVKDRVRDVLLRAALPQIPQACYAAWSVDDAVNEIMKR